MRRWQDVGLVLLALLTVVLVWATFRSLESTPAASPAPTRDPGSAGGTGAASDPATGDPATTTAVDAAASTTEAPGEEGVLEEARALVQREERTVVLVLGDSTGNDRGEWTFRWAEALAGTRPTWIAPWNEWTEDGYIDPVTLGTDQDGGTLTLYVGHQSGAGAAYPVERLETLVPEEPDLVILNYGHNDTVDSVGSGTADTLDALRRRFGAELPVVVTLQQPQADDANAEVRSALADLAADEGLPTIDVAAAFEATGDPAALLADAVHPDEDGAALWARTVAGTLSAP